MAFARSVRNDNSRTSGTISTVVSTTQIQLDIAPVGRSGHRFNDYHFA